MRIDLNQAAQALHESDQTSKLGLADEAYVSLDRAPGEGPAQLSVARAQMQVLIAQVSQLPEIRQEKVTALRRMVLGRVYQPPLDQLAEAVFVHMLVKPAA